MKKNDVSGLVLSMGEKTTKEAIERLKSQTIALAKIILIKNVSPWSKAFSAGLSRVNTEFFINCNADMLLYTNCVKKLLSYMEKDVGLVIGGLKDSLCGTVLGIKLYRSEAVKSFEPNKNSVSPDNDLANEMMKSGWKIIFAEKNKLKGHSNFEILGLHSPEYAPLYTYKKFKTLGARITKRNSLGSLHEYLHALRENNHPMAKIAITALLTGLFCSFQKNMLDFADVEEEFMSIKNSIDKINIKEDYEANEPLSISEHDSPRNLFKNFFHIGANLRYTLSFDKFNNLLNQLLKKDNKRLCFSAAGLCHGFFYYPYIADPDIDKEWLKISHIT